MSKKALLIGINDYPTEAGLCVLKYAEADAQEMASTLTRTCGFRSQLLLGRSATRDAIEQALLEAGTGETFLFFFAGHGQCLAGQYNIHPQDSTAAGLKALPFGNIARQWQHNFGYGQVLAILDACRSEMRGTRGGRGLDVVTSRDIVAATQGDRWVEVLYGCSEGEVSYEVDQFKHGLFTRGLLKVLSEHEGELDSRTLAGAASDWMEDWCRGDPQGRRQHAHRYGHESLRKRIVLLESATGQRPASRTQAAHQSGGAFRPKPQTKPDRKKPKMDKGRSQEITGDALPQSKLAAPPKRPLPGERRTLAGFAMVWVPPGSFMMGSPADEHGHNRNESLHSVTLSGGVWIGRCPVTREEWASVLKLTEQSDRNVPVTSVSWDDCQTFASRLTQVSGIKFRLPTEAEWECACRAGSSGRFCFGDDEGRLADYAWFDQCGVAHPQPVRRKKPNAWDLYDMHGNVWEWCSDWYGPLSSGPEASPASVPAEVDPAGPPSGEKRVIRGGAFSSFADYCRSAKREGHRPGERVPMIGLRLVAEPEPAD